MAKRPVYAVEIEPPAWAAIMALPQRAQDSVLSAIETLEKDPRPGNAKPLKGTLRGLWRVRAGDYRVIYSIEDNRLVVVVVKVGNRREVYE